MSNGLGPAFYPSRCSESSLDWPSSPLWAPSSPTRFTGRTGRVPAPLRYLFAALFVCVLGVTGFGVLLLYDGASALAGLVAVTVLVPFLVVSVYLERTTELARVDVIVAAVMGGVSRFSSEPP